MIEARKKYFVSEIYPQALYTAGSLREDIETILTRQGYIPLHTGPDTSNVFKKLVAYRKIKKVAEQVEENTIVFFHFPLRSGLNRFLFTILKDKGIRTVAYVHDLEGLRDQDPSVLNDEMADLKHFDAILVQNEKMKEVVEEGTGNKKIVLLEMYDYLGIKLNELPVPDKTKPIVFAGNLNKASFLQQLRDLPSLRFIVYGEGGKAMNAINVIHEGKEDPRILPSLLASEGSFGLVWDGSSIETGRSEGNYLRYNIPHKLALYIISGLPLIVWKDSAMANWVRQHKIGIIISSLTEIKERIDRVTDREYEQFMHNIIPLRKKMVEGNYLEEALHQIEEKLSFT